MLESEFGTSKEEDVVKQILEKGTVQETEVCFLSLSTCIPLLSTDTNTRLQQSSERQGDRNLTNGSFVAH